MEGLLSNFVSDELSMETLLSIFSKIRNDTFYEEVSVLVIIGDKNSGKEVLAQVIESMYTYRDEDLVAYCEQGEEKDQSGDFDYYDLVRCDTANYLEADYIYELDGITAHSNGKYFFIVECEECEPLGNSSSVRKPMIITLKNIIPHAHVQCVADKCMSGIRRMLGNKDKYEDSFDNTVSGFFHLEHYMRAGDMNTLFSEYNKTDKLNHMVKKYNNHDKSAVLFYLSLDQEDKIKAKSWMERRAKSHIITYV